ncbi:hypothetical protein QTP88_017124 [Uroleucon formosanum]
MSPVDIIRNVDIYCTQLWDSNWRQVTDNKSREIKHSVELWPKLNYSNRKEEVIMNRLRIGHTRVTHGYLMEKTDPSICHSCNSLTTVKHIIIDCQISTEIIKFEGTDFLSCSDESILFVSLTFHREVRFTASELNNILCRISEVLILSR